MPQPRRGVRGLVPYNSRLIVLRPIPVTVTPTPTIAKASPPLMARPLGTPEKRIAEKRECPVCHQHVRFNLARSSFYSHNLRGSTEVCVSFER
jgi:hypothetical protein